MSSERVVVVTEPFFVAQTFEPEHLASSESIRAWCLARAAEAKERGGTFPRYAINDGNTGLLIEVWAVRPKDQGEPRWSLTGGDD